MAESNSVGKLFGGATATVISALLIGAIGGLLILWRDVGIIAKQQETTLEENSAQHVINKNFSITEERVRSMTDVLTRFRTAYDRRESQTDELLSKHLAMIAELQRTQQSLMERLRQVERAQFGREQAPP